MAQAINFATTNPAQLTDRTVELQTAVVADEANNLAVATYTAPGAISLGGVAILAAGGTTAIAMTLALLFTPDSGKLFIYFQF